MLTTNKKEKLMFIPTRFRNEKGAIDLSSIMVGIIVLGLIGAVIAATVFAIIPWAQDQAAKKQLQSVTVAQNAYAGLDTANKSSIALAAAETTNDADKRVFGSLKDLNSKDLIAIDVNPDKPWLSVDGKLCTNQTETGFESAIQSASGNVFRTTDGSKIERITDPAELNTTCLGVLDTAQPIEPAEEGIMEMEYTCPTSTNISIPGAQGFTGNVKLTLVDGVREADVTNWDGSGINLHLNKGQLAVITMKGKYAPTMKPVGDDAGRDCLINVTEWDADTGQQDASGAFEGYRRLLTVPPPPATVNNMANMFSMAHSFNGDTSDWDVSNVTDMSFMFAGAYMFNKPVNNWDVSNVTTMKGMFSATVNSDVGPPSFRAQLSSFSDDDYDLDFGDFSLFNQPLNKWDVSKVTDMEQMFWRAHSFNQPLNQWDTSNVTTMKGMFTQANSFNQNLNGWNVSKVIDMESMFEEAKVFNGNISSWATSQLRHMNNMFMNANSFNQNLNSWNVSNITSMTGVFANASAFNQPLNRWDVSHVTNMADMFNNATSFNQNLNDWNVRSLTNTTSTFEEASAFNQPLNNWSVAPLAEVYYMFSGATRFNQNIDNWDVSRVRDFTQMFRRTGEFNSPLNSWNLHNAEDLYGMFEGARKFNQPLDQWDTGNVRDMGSMFSRTGLFQQNLTSWDVSNVASMNNMFSYTSYNQPLNGWNVSRVQAFNYMFYENPTFNQDIRDWDTRSATHMNHMFEVERSNPATSQMSYNLSGWNVDSIQEWFPFGPMPQAHMPQFIKSS